MIDWYIEGTQFGNCNCAYGCPCQFEAEPTYDDCIGFEVVHIEKGHYGDVDLGGLNVAMLTGTEEPVHEGKGNLQVVIDELADSQQRNSLVQILHGKETEDAATHWWVYCMLADIIHPALYKPIEFNVDIEARTALVNIPGVLESTGRPIIAAHSGKEHRVAIRITNGIEFEISEMGSASSKTGSESAVRLDIEDRYGQFNRIRLSGSGVIHS
jgi:hypothetical protein